MSIDLCDSVCPYVSSVWLHRQPYAQLATEGALLLMDITANELTGINLQLRMLRYIRSTVVGMLLEWRDGRFLGMKLRINTRDMNLDI